MIYFNKTLILDGDVVEESKILVFSTLFASVPIQENQTVYTSKQDLQEKTNGINVQIPSEIANSFGVVEATKGILSII